MGRASGASCWVHARQFRWTSRLVVGLAVGQPKKMAPMPRDRHMVVQKETAWQPSWRKQHTEKLLVETQPFQETEKIRRAERRAREDLDDPAGAAGRAEARERKRLFESFKCAARAETSAALERQLREEWGPGYVAGDLWISEEEEMEEEAEEEEEAKEEEEEPEEEKDPAELVATAAGIPTKRKSR